jgi:hypothetical protein
MLEEVVWEGSPLLDEDGDENDSSEDEEIDVDKEPEGDLNHETLDNSTDIVNEQERDCTNLDGKVRENQHERNKFKHKEREDDSDEGDEKGDVARSSVEALIKKKQEGKFLGLELASNVSKVDSEDYIFRLEFHDVDAIQERANVPAVFDGYVTCYIQDDDLKKPPLKLKTQRKKLSGSDIFGDNLEYTFRGKSPLQFFDKCVIFKLWCKKTIGLS